MAPTNAFSVAALKKHWGLIPTVAICGAACVMCASYVAHMALRKPDLSWTPWRYSTDPPYVNIKPTEVRKFINMHKLNPDAEVEALKREVAAAYRTKSS